MFNLPHELICVILENLENERSTLYSLSLTSKQLNDEASKLLYASMIEHDVGLHYHFLEALESNPKLATYVRVYHVPDEAIGQMPNHVWARIRKGLRSMINLKELLIGVIFNLVSPGSIPPIVDPDNNNDNYDEAEEAPSARTRYRPPFQLERFICLSHSWIRAPSDIARFLGTQYRLKYLVWTIPGSLPESIPDTLKCIGGHSDIIWQMLCLKPSIREVRWDNVMDPDTPENIRLFELEAFKNLRVLRFVSQTPIQSAVMRYIRGNGVGPFVNLDMLILGTLHGLDDLGILRAFPKLSKLVITTSWHPQPWFTLEDQPRIIGGLFAEYDNLVEVDLRLEDRWEYCRRWMKGRLLDGYHPITQEELLEYR